MPTNQRRAIRAQIALRAYLHETYPANRRGESTGIRDLMADLLHLAEDRGLDARHEMEVALAHYEAER